MSDGDFYNTRVPYDIKDAIGRITYIFSEALASGKHKPGDWRELGENGNWEHFHEHLLKLEAAYRDGEDHLANLCCRALLRLQFREESRREASTKR